MPWLTTRRLVSAAIAAWIAVAAIGVAIGPSLGHDEAAFAVAARGDAGWLYRSEGTVTIARIGVAAGGADWQMRLASAVLGTGVVIAAFAAGRAAFDARTGAWAAAVVAGAHPMALRSAQLLGDLPATAALVGGIAVLVAELDRDAGPRWRIVAAAPLFAAAFYLRYGSAPVIGLALGAAALWWRTVRARPAPVVALLGALALLVVPHVVRSMAATGEPLGILEVAAGMPRRTYLGEGLVTYLASNPFAYYGALVAPVMVAGLIGVWRTRRCAPWYLAIVGVGQVVLLGVQSHGQPRYVFVATVLAVVLGVDAVRRLAHGRARATAVAAAAVAAAWIGVVVATVVVCRREELGRAPVVRAAMVMRDDAAGRSCAAIAALAPQLMWYSGCAVLPVGVDAVLPADRTRYAVWLRQWPIAVERVAAAQHARAAPIEVDAAQGVWRLE